MWLKVILYVAYSQTVAVHVIVFPFLSFGETSFSCVSPAFVFISIALVSLSNFPHKAEVTQFSCAAEAKCLGVAEKVYKFA